MKIKTFFIPVILLAILVSCNSMSTVEQRLVSAATVMPQQIIFQNEYLDIDHTKRCIVKSTITVNVQNSKKFALEAVTEIINKFSAEEINEVAARPIPDIGFGKHDQKIPDSLQFEYNAWLLATAGLALQAQQSANDLDQYTFTEYDFSNKGEAILTSGSSKSTMQTEFGEITVVINRDYENAPQGMILEP